MQATSTRLLRHLLPFALAAAAAAALPAQRVVVVDASNGPGTDHTTLAGAFAGLLEGDYIVVRAGVYTGVDVTTMRSFVMVGEGDPVVEPGANPSHTMQLTCNGSSYQRIAIRGVTFHSQLTGQWALRVRTNYQSWPAPALQLEDCTILSMSLDADRVGLSAESVGLTAQGCTMNTTQVRDCLASFVGCYIWGHDQSFNGPFSQRAQTALDVLDSEVWIVDSQLVAGDSNFVYGPPASCLGVIDQSFTMGSRVHVGGQSTLQCDQTPNTSWPMPYVVENYQTFWPIAAALDLEATTAIVPGTFGLTFSNNVTVNYTTVHHLTASAAQLGGAFACSAHGDVNDVAILLLASASYASAPLGIPVLLDPLNFVIFDFGLVGASQDHAFAPFAVPNDLALRSLVLQAHAVFLTPSGGLVGSNPASGILFD